MSHPTGDTPGAEAPEGAPHAAPDDADDAPVEGVLDAAPATTPETAHAPGPIAQTQVAAEPIAQTQVMAEPAAETEPGGGCEDGEHPVEEGVPDNTIRNAAIGGVVGVFLVAGAMVATALGLPMPWTGSGPDYGAAREIPITDASDEDPYVDEEWVPAYLVPEAPVPEAPDGGATSTEPSQETGGSAVPTTTVASEDTSTDPVARDDRITIRANTTVNLYVLDNDSDPDRNLHAATLSVVSSPSHALRFSVEGHHFRYRPHRDGSERFVPEDGFVYEVCDPTGLCDTATVTILVVSD